MSDEPLPPYAVLVRHQVADYDTWKAGFDEDEDARRAAGFLGHHINRAEDDPNLISVYLALTDLEQAKAMATDDRLKDIMQSAGVISAPEFTWMIPAREAIAWDRELPAFILSHRVADFDAWLAAYNEVDDLRLRSGHRRPRRQPVARRPVGGDGVPPGRDVRRRCGPSWPTPTSRPR